MSSLFLPARPLLAEVGRRASPFRPAARALALVALLLAEIIFLSVRFDAQPLIGRTEPWAVAVLQVPWLTRFGLLAALITVLFVVLARRGASLPLAPPTRARAALYLTLHGLALGLFAALTVVILENDVGRSEYVNVWVAAWAALGLSVLAFWAAAAVAPRQWPALARQTWPAAAAGALVGAAVWGASRFTGALWDELGAATFHASAALLRLLTPDVVCEPERAVVGTSTFRVQIAAACSGYEGLALMAAFVAAYLGLFRRELRFPHALVLLPLGLALVWLANVARIAALIAVGTWVSPAVALGGFHSQAGWLGFLAVALGLAAVSWRSPWFHPAAAAPQAPAEARRADPTAAYLLPLLALLLAQMLTTALTDGFDFLLPLRVLAVSAVLAHYRREYDRPLWAWSWLGAALGVAVFALWVALEPLYRASAGAGELPAHLAQLPPWAAAAWLALRVVQSVVVVPLAEELAFRGYLLRRLIAADFTDVSPRRFTFLSFFLSSLLFGLLHGRWVAGTLCGMLFALAVYRRGRLADAVLAHAIANGLIAACVLLGGAWYFWN